MYQQAAQANPGDVRPLLGMADSLLAMGSNAEAAQAYGAALAVQPSNLDALRGLGHARILLGQPQFAVTQYQTALKIAPNDTRILNGLGVAQDMMGDHAAAQKSYHQVLTLDPANQSAKNNLALSMALAGDDAGAIKILEDVSKSPTASAVNRQNLALLYGVNGQMQQAAQASRADLPPDAVNRNMAAMSASGDAAKKQELLKESLGVELRGRQYAPAAKPVKPLTELAQSSSIEDDQQAYMSASQQGDPLPVITTGQAARTQTAQAGPPPAVIVKTNGKKDGWSDWDEELVDATDVNGAAGTPAAKPEAAPSDTSSQDAGAPRFLSSDAIGTNNPAKPVETAPAKPTADSSTTTTQVATLPPAATATTTSAPEKPATSASATPAAAPEKPALTTSTTTAAAPAASAPTAAPAPAAAPASQISTESSMTVTAKSLDVAKIYTVQIASYRSEQEASAGWQALTAERGDLLAKLPHAVAKADLGAEKGVFYRLQAGSFSDRKDAKALCSDLKNHSIDCMVVEATPATAASSSSQQSMLDPNNSFVIGAR
jgi:Flp pilus assembly protein TadD